MTKLELIRSARALTACLALPPLSFAAQVPRPSPEFAIQMTPSGQTLLSQYTGKVVLLAFLSTS